MLLRPTGVRVSGGDLCRLQSAEAPTEPAGETRALPCNLRIATHTEAVLRCPKFITACSAYEFWPLRHNNLVSSATGSTSVVMPVKLHTHHLWTIQIVHKRWCIASMPMKPRWLFSRLPMQAPQHQTRHSKIYHLNLFSFLFLLSSAYLFLLLSFYLTSLPSGRSVYVMPHEFIYEI